MHKVITIDVSGQVYQLDERGYDALRAYLEQADAQLAGNPDKYEILRDLEQSIAEKFARYAGASGKVVAANEVAEVLGQVGPVDGGIPPAAGMPANGAKGGPRRLYQIREGAMLSGVCNGLAAYVDVDPTLVRIAFVLAALSEIAHFDQPPALTIGLYVLLMFLVPYANPATRPAGPGTNRTIPRTVQRGVERVKGLFGSGFKPA